MTKTGSSSNSNKAPYAKFGFKGTEETQKGNAKVKGKRESGTLELMPPEEWEQFCVFKRLRSHLEKMNLRSIQG